MPLSHPKICLPHFRKSSKGEPSLFLGTSFLSLHALAARCIFTWFEPRLIIGCTVFASVTCSGVGHLSLFSMTVEIVGYLCC